MNVEGLSKPVSVDCAFGGMWYAIVDADLLEIDIVATKGGEIAKLGEKIKVIFFQQIFAKFKMKTLLLKTFINAMAVGIIL